MAWNTWDREVQIRTPCYVCRAIREGTTIRDVNKRRHTKKEKAACKDGYVYEWIDADNFVTEHQVRPD